MEHTHKHEEQLMLGEVSNFFAEIALFFTAVSACFTLSLKRLDKKSDDKEFRTYYIMMFGLFLFASSFDIYFATDSILGRILTGVCAAVTLVLTTPLARLAWRQRKGRPFSFCICWAIVFSSTTVLTHAISMATWAQMIVIVSGFITSALVVKWLHLQLFKKAQREFVE